MSYKPSSAEIRKKFLEFFDGKGHRICPSYPLVPANDPTLLFTNAGMVQFKDVFTGRESRPYKRAASSQKCVRAGGKHNDLENVGYTARHHTFFEMLGNFSFGDYFKREAIAWAWEFLTGWMKLDPQRLWVSVFEGDTSQGLPPDDEAAAIWRDVVGVPEERILRFGAKDNFWSMGDTGPCGPCSEIHYDQGDLVECNQPGGCEGVACECDRYLEVWNLVFMQFERSADGRLTPLPAPSIDTGMGLERLAAIMQGESSNYHTDLFMPLIDRAALIAGTSYGAAAESDVSLRVVADHARATAFLMADGVLPSNEGRGYVLRRIMRRAIRHGHKLGIERPFLHEVCAAVVELMSPVYPELRQRQEMILAATEQEEVGFRRTLGNGLRLLDREIAKLIERGEKVVPGELVFELQARDGFPPDLTAVIVRERGLEIDQQGYDRAFDKHRQVSAGALGLEGIDPVYVKLADRLGETDFTGYGSLSGKGRVTAVLEVEFEPSAEGDFTKVTARAERDRIEAGRWAEIVLDKSPFYGESGGQVGDTGVLSARGMKARVVDTQKPAGGMIVHRVRVEKGSLEKGMELSCRVDAERRRSIMRHHSATHLLQAALRKVLGPHVNQSGSLVAPDYFRFDFTHFAAVSEEQLRECERLVNRFVQQNLPVKAEWTDIESARLAGATMLFGEKYGERVRMVRMGSARKPVSLELCGGTHVGRTGDIGAFVIVSEGSVKAGIRRIEALAGLAAIEWVQKKRKLTERISGFLKTDAEHLPETVERLRDRVQKLEKELEQARQKLAEAGSGADPISQARRMDGAGVLAVFVQGLRMASMREFADRLRDRLGRGAVLVMGEERGKLQAVCSVSRELT
ncbi:MAG: alanine--tRNA ligase, partial [Deltaproteobacteria bacterium]